MPTPNQVDAERDAKCLASRNGFRQQQQQQQQKSQFKSTCAAIYFEEEKSLNNVVY